MPGDLVFITGANGHVGFATLLQALKQGYHVKAAVRAQSKADTILNAASTKALNPGDALSFTIIPDMLAPGAYDAALAEAKYAIHIASPLGSGEGPEEFESGIVAPAIKGTIAFLEAAAKSSTLKRVVITSSILALFPFSDQKSGASKTYNERSRVSDTDAGGPWGSEIEAYTASKTLALNAGERWMGEHQPGFDLVHIHPSYVFGRDELTGSAEELVSKGTNRLVMLPFVGVPLPPLLNSSVFVEDVAQAHVRALDGDIPGGSSIVPSSEMRWERAVEAVKERFPKAVESGVLKIGEPTKTIEVGVDTSESEKLLGWKFKGFEEQVSSIVEHYLELKGVEAA